MKRYDISRLPKSIVPMFLLPRFNVVIGNFRRESFAVLTAFRPDRGLDDNLVAQSALVDRVKSAGLGWFPLYWDWGDEVTRSLFIHRLTVAEAEVRRKRSPGTEDPAPRPELELVLSLRRQAGLDRFAWGEKGKYLVYAGDPPLPVGAGDRLRLAVDYDFICFREQQKPGSAQTSENKTKKN